MSIWGWLLLGAGTWALAVALKVAADVVAQRTMTAALRDWAASALSGVWSSICELGLTALAFWLWSATFADALVMAVGAALTEFVVLLIPAFAANWGKQAPSKLKQAQGWSAFFLERSVAIASHLTSRALLWLGIGGNAGFKAVASAFALFATAEAIQAYAQAKEWDWLNRRTLLTFVAFQGLCIFAQLTLFVFWRA
jgi:hypothetical protein